jgi:hypothetical protein
MKQECISETGHRWTAQSCPFLDADGVCNHPVKVNRELPYRCQAKPDAVPMQCDLRRLAARLIVTCDGNPDQDSGYVPVLVACLIGAGVAFCLAMKVMVMI